MTTASSPRGSSFSRRPRALATIGAASVAGLTLFGTTPAFAASDDCLPANTVDAGSGGTAADIQALLDADTPVICLSGTFPVTATLSLDYDLTLIGLSGAVLDGGNTTQILTADEGTTLTVDNLTFQNGTSDSGGAISGDIVNVTNSTFVGNAAGNSGGAIDAYDLSVETSTFTGNSAAVGGAILGYFVTVDSSTFESNSADISGGAIAGYGDVFVGNSTFVGNAAGADGGAIVASYGVIALSTFLDNSAGGAGESVFLGLGDPPIANGVYGNIFAGSSSDPQLSSTEGVDLNDFGGNVFSTESEPSLTDVQESSKFSQTTAAIFNGATLADNGGPTRTVALYAGSPAVGAVPASADFTATVDQRGVARDAAIDAGAYEFVPPVVPAVLPPTGSGAPGWVAGVAGLMIAAGAVVLGAVRRRRA